jgi:hypothetical protein
MGQFFTFHLTENSAPQSCHLAPARAISRQSSRFLTRNSELIWRLQIARYELGLESAITKLEMYPDHPR